MENKFEELISRITELENRPKSFGMTEGDKRRIEGLEKKLAQIETETSKESEVFPEPSLSNAEFESFQKIVDLRFDNFEKKQLDNVKDASKDINILKESIRELKEVKHVSPTSHESHTKDIMELNEKILMIYGLENKVKDLVDENKRLTSKSEKSERDFAKLLQLLDTKTDLENFNKFTKSVAMNRKDVKKLFEHVDNHQIEIDTMKNETGPDFEKMIAMLQKQVDQNYDVTLVRAHNNEKELEKINSSIMAIRSTGDKAETNTIKLAQVLDGTQKKLNNLDEAFNSFIMPKDILNGGNDTSEMDVVKESLSSLRKEFFRFKDEASTNFSVIGDTLETNADKHDLGEVEKKLQDKIDKNIKVISRTKNDIRRLAKDFEEKAKKGQFTSPTKVNPRDDALFARKHEGWKCASCEKDLVNMAGLPVEFYNWKKLPKREIEKISMVINNDKNIDGTRIFKDAKNGYPRGD